MTTQLKYNNNKKHNLLVFYEIWKKYNEIQLTKNKWTWTIEKLKIIHPPMQYMSKSVGPWMRFVLVFRCR